MKNCLQGNTSISQEFINEAFADWFASEAFFREVNEYVNPETGQKLTDEEKRRKIIESVFFCSDDEPSKGEKLIHQWSTGKEWIRKHPSGSDRVNQIFRAHPEFNRIMGCPFETQPKYCDKEGKSL